MRSKLRRLAAFLLLAVLLTPIGYVPAYASQTVALPADDQQIAVTLPSYVEQEQGSGANDAPTSPETVGSLSEPSWTQQVAGRVGSATDVDYFSFTLSQPASRVRLGLTGMTANYDLVLAGGPDASQGFDPGQPGLEGVTEIGSQISAIGSQISAIGSQISAIGSQISAIGSQISAIGSQISAISANSGSEAEQIDSLLWLPGRYYVVVAPNNGAFEATPYQLSVQVDGSGLTPPPAAPEVELLRSPTDTPAANQVTTLYIVHSGRLRQLYNPTLNDPVVDDQIRSINSNLARLAVTNPPQPAGSLGPTEYGYVVDLRNLQQIGGTQSIDNIYALWDTNQNNPLYANLVAGLIDNIVEAVSEEDATPGVSGANPRFRYGSGSQPLFLPNLRNVVLVGGDDVLPFFRIPDLATIANEADYAAYLATRDASGVIEPASPLGAALRSRMLLTDNPYGTARPYRFYGYPFSIPRLAVGRLVETPENIARYLDNYTYSNTSFGIEPDYTINVTSGGGEVERAFVSGYDFLKDQASEVSRTLRRAGLIIEDTNQLISDTWTRTNFEQFWVNRNIDNAFPNNTTNSPFANNEIQLASLNAHFDHWRVLPAVYTDSDAATTFPAQRLLTPGYTPSSFDPNRPGGFFRNTLNYSVGCHSGYSVSEFSVPGRIAGAPVYRADFAQAINRHAGNWIGNTGFGYGTLDGIDYSERLAVLLTEELARNISVESGGEPAYLGQSIGEALHNAKQRYVRNATLLSAYDYKAVSVMTLYGLPYLRSFVSNPLDPPAEEPQVGPNGEPLPTPSGSEAPSTVAANSFGLLTRVITVDVDLDISDYATVTRGSSTVGQILNLDEADFAVSDSFIQQGFAAQPKLRVFNNNQVGAPTLPTFGYDISALNAAGNERLRVKDVIFLGGDYGSQSNFNPLITQIVTETDDPLSLTPIEPSFAEGAGIWYPDKFFGFSTVGEGEQQRDQLVAAAAQFRGDANGATGTLRPYKQLVFEVLYQDPSSTPEPVSRDTQGPLIESVRIEAASGAARGAQNQPQATVLIRASDGGSGLREVAAVYVLNNTVWREVSFGERAKGVFAATLPFDPGEVRIIARATDNAGNSSYYTARGTFLPPVEPNRVRLPFLVR